MVASGSSQRESVGSATSSEGEPRHYYRQVECPANDVPRMAKVNGLIGQLIPIMYDRFGRLTRSAGDGHVRRVMSICRDTGRCQAHHVNDQLIRFIVMAARSRLASTCQILQVTEILRDHVRIDPHSRLTVKGKGRLRHSLVQHT